MHAGIIHDALVDFVKVHPHCEIDCIRVYTDLIRIWYYDPEKDEGGHWDYCGPF